MKKTLFTFTLIMAMALVAHAQSDTPYFQESDLADATLYLPPPPDTTSAQFEYDKSQFEWGRSMRETERGQVAVSEVNGLYPFVCNLYSTAFGMTISPEATPAIYKVLANSLKSAANATSACKSYYHRQRPFSYYGEEMFTGESLGNSSYPSTHAAKGWILALLLTEINPKAEVELLKKGYEYGQNRVIVGAHWQSDVDAARLVAAYCYARLQSDSTFRADMEDAKKEYKQLINAAIDDITIDETDHNKTADGSTQWYTIDGIPAGSDTHGIVVSRRGKKINR
ncbi:MAG: phosphatase PAP2 family protein [Muribaculaceae bacterium]|nr:phosphatase PAP2 family protein [Muribaculaceae bacterium]